MTLIYSALMVDPIIHFKLESVINGEKIKLIYIYFIYLRFIIIIFKKYILNYKNKNSENFIFLIFVKSYIYM